MTKTIIILSLQLYVVSFSLCFWISLPLEYRTLSADPWRLVNSCADASSVADYICKSNEVFSARSFSILPSDHRWQHEMGRGGSMGIVLEDDGEWMCVLLKYLIFEINTIKINFTGVYEDVA